MTDSVKKSAIVMFSSGGIGGEVASSPAQAVVAELKATGAPAISAQTDVASVPDVKRP